MTYIDQNRALCLRVLWSICRLDVDALFRYGV